MSQSRARLISRIGGVCLMGGGVWLACGKGSATQVDLNAARPAMNMNHLSYD